MIDQNILKPILELRTTEVTISDDTKLTLNEVNTFTDSRLVPPGSTGLEIFTKQLINTIKFLKQSLYKKFPSLYFRIKRRSSARFISTLLGTSLPSLLPMTEKDMLDFEEKLTENTRLIQTTLIEAEWLSSSSTEITSWVENIHIEWINRKSISTMVEIRKCLKKLTLNPSTPLSRVIDTEFSQDATSQTQQQVPEIEVDDSWDNWNDDDDADIEENIDLNKSAKTESKNKATPKTEPEDNWDNWNDEDEDVKVTATKATSAKKIEEPVVDTEDSWDAWGDDPIIDDEEENPVSSTNTSVPKQQETEEQADDGWDAWDDNAEIIDDDDDESDVQVTGVKKSTPQSKEPVVKHTKPQKDIKSTTTQKESDSKKDAALLCSISTIPSTITQIIINSVNEVHRFIDHQKLHNQRSLKLRRNSNTQAANPLINSNESAIIEKLISDLIAMFRALCERPYERAPSTYIIYNDLIHLIHLLATADTEFSKGILVPEERETLFNLADYQYSLSLSEHENKLKGILAKAKGFKHCNGSENLFACQGAIERTTNLFYTLSEELDKYISFPLKVKCLGALLEFVASTMINAIETQDDIAEEESIELSKLIRVLKQLETLFNDPTTEDPATKGGFGNYNDFLESQQAQQSKAEALVAYYTPSWIKLQYLEKILVSNLHEISEMFQENMLVDFTPKELENLIHALFAPSENRKATISLIYNSY